MNFRFFSFFVIAGMILIGCGSETPAPNPAPVRSESELADSIFSGGEIVTIDSALPQVEAVAVKAGPLPS